MVYFKTFLLTVLCIAVANCLLTLPKDKSFVYNSVRVDKAHPSSNNVELPSSFKESLVKYHQLSASAKSSHHVVQKRDSTSNCGLEGRHLEADAVELKETAETIQAVWVGKDIILIIASDKMVSGKTTLWRGEIKKGLGLFQFDDDRSAIKLTVYPDSLQVSPVEPRNIVVIVSYSQHHILVSRDYGKEWDQYTTPTVDFDPKGGLYLSERNPMHMVIHSRNGDLFVSDSLGKRWIHVASRVPIAEFGRTSLGEHLYFTTQSGTTNSNPLYRMDISSMNKQVIDRTTYRFRVDNRYLFISRKNTTENPKADQHSRRLYVSNKYDADSSVGFTEVQLPSLQDQEFYAVMATHESGAFIHVYKGSDSNSGNLYVSDSTGSRFTLSLQNHLFDVHQYPLGHYTVHDFYEVSSTRGVYITTTVNPGDHGHVTKITFNNGGSWQRLKAPENSNCYLPDCSLHLHLRYSQYVLPFFNYSSLKFPLSVESAPGIIIAHGSVGQTRDNSSPKLYISSDGGHTWFDPNLPVGTYIYGIGDYGNIIAVAPDSENVPYMWFSHNRGKCFVKETFDLTSQFTTRGILIDPSAASLFGFVMGVEGLGSTDEWRLITLNFKSLLQKPCGTNDYTKVTEHQSMDTCLLGYSNVYNLTKDEIICYNQAGYNYKPIKIVNCSCSYSDYECDYGFNRTSRTTCSKLPNLSLSSVCPPGAKTYKESVSGFRLIPGDYCTPTTESTKLLEQLELTCTGHEKQSGIHPVSFSTMSTAGKIIGAFFLVVIAIVAAGLTLYCWLKCRRNNKSYERVVYQRVPLRETNGKFSANDESSSDEDLLT